MNSKARHLGLECYGFSRKLQTIIADVSDEYLLRSRTLMLIAQVTSGEKILNVEDESIHKLPKKLIVWHLATSTNSEKLHSICFYDARICALLQNMPPGY